MTSKSATGPTRVVIVGGGCAGMAAAWELAKQPDYDIHVYEKAPRLGGKGSSTRADDGRILEHGLHVWMGWYENAFRMMRECYAVVEDEAVRGKTAGTLAHLRFDDAFTPEPNVGLVKPNFQDSEPVTWSVYFPPNEGRPGTPMTSADNPFTMASYMTRLVEMARALILSEVGDMPGDTPGASRPDQRSRSDEILNLDQKTPPADSTAALLNRMAELSKATALTGAAALLQLVTILEVWLRHQNLGPKAPESTLAIAEAAVSQVRKLLRDLVAMDPKLRMKTEVIDIVLTIMIGLFTDRVMFRPDGLDSLNDFDYRDWLLKHGATRTSVESRFIRAAYDFAFAYEDGDPKTPRLAAGVALRGGLRMFFTYRGAAFWRMCSGMGDAIFAPLYAVLEDWRTQAEADAEAHAKNQGLPENRYREHYKSVAKQRENDRAMAKGGRRQADMADELDLPNLQSPVTFHFGHELKRATLKDGAVQKVEFAITSDVPDPLVNGGWPDAPEPRGIETSLVLQRREDASQPLTKGDKTPFDFLIVATGVHEFEDVFVTPHDVSVETYSGTGDGSKVSGEPPLARPEPPDATLLNAWRETTKLTKTVATKAAQLWLDKSLYELGWRRGSGLFTCIEGAFDTYADMTHLLPAESRMRRDLGARVRGPERQSLAYFCNPMEQKAVKQARERMAKAVEITERGLETPGASVADRVALVKAFSRGVNARFAGIDDIDIESVLAVGRRLGFSSIEEIATVENWRAVAAVFVEQAPRIEVGDDLSKFLGSRDLDTYRESRMAGFWPDFRGALAAPGRPAKEPAKTLGYARANFQGSERYTLSLPGTIASRISPLDPGLDNMTVAGDWTACGLDCGCVEAAVISGMLAATAISGAPALSDIVGYDQP